MLTIKDHRLVRLHADINILFYTLAFLPIENGQPPSITETRKSAYCGIDKIAQFFVYLRYVQLVMFNILGLQYKAVAILVCVTADANLLVSILNKRLYSEYVPPIVLLSFFFLTAISFFRDLVVLL